MDPSFVLLEEVSYYLLKNPTLEKTLKLILGSSFSSFFFKGNLELYRRSACSLFGSKLNFKKKIIITFEVDVTVPPKIQQIIFITFVYLH